MEMMPKCNAFIINLLRGLCHIGIVTEECFDIIKIADKEYQVLNKQPFMTEINYHTFN